MIWHRAIVDLIQAVLAPDSVEDPAQPDALGLITGYIAAYGLMEILPKTTTLRRGVSDYGIDPLMADSSAGQECHGATDFLWAPLLSRPATVPLLLQALCLLGGGPASIITERLGLLGIIAIDGEVTKSLTADHVAV